MGVTLLDTGRNASTIELVKKHFVKFLLNCALVPFWNMKYSASSDCYWICDGRWCRWQSRSGPCYHILAPVRSSCHLVASSRNNFRQQLFGRIRFLHIVSCSPCNPNIVFINWTYTWTLKVISKKICWKEASDHNLILTPYISDFHFIIFAEKTGHAQDLNLYSIA